MNEKFGVTSLRSIVEMEGTPKIKKRVSLSLARHQKREASAHLPHGTTYSKVREIVLNNFDDDEDYKRKTPKSPSVSAISSDAGVACTPPYKKFNLDDSVEYSPRFCDSSNSPSYLLSQTLTSNSPEVGWKWGRCSVDDQVEATAMTPDSAFAADICFTTAVSSSRDARNSLGRVAVESNSQRLAYEKQKEEHRRRLEIEMRRAEKQRADELLKQRCVKLEEQLKEAEKRRKESIGKSNPTETQCQQKERNNNDNQFSNSHKDPSADLAVIEDIFSNGNDTFDDFFNDSVADDLLLEATQKVESEIVEVTQSASNDICIANTNKRDTTSECVKMRHAVPTTTNTSERQEKRSSLYMKFLEDDSPDDWFLSLDDVILEATQQSKKPRNAFQRHHSMPTNTISTSATGSASATSTLTTIPLKKSETSSRGVTSSTITTSTVSSPKMKRHASSHAFNASSGAVSSYRDRQAYSRK